MEEAEEQEEYSAGKLSNQVRVERLISQVTRETKLNRRRAPRHKRRLNQLGPATGVGGKKYRTRVLFNLFELR
jgi:hypothetical protein